MKTFLFWISFFSILYLVALFILIIVGVYYDGTTIVWHKEYALFFVPLLLLLMIGFVVSFCELITKDN